MAFAPSFPPNAGDFGLFSPAPSNGAGSSHQRDMVGLDSSINADNYPYIGAYQGLLQGDGVPGRRGPPPARIGAKSGGVSFVPPHPTTGASESRKRPASRGTVCRTRAGSGGARAESTVKHVP
jgi:hypothetical protein